MDDAKPDKNEGSSGIPRILSGGISIVGFAVTCVFYQGIQEASALQLVAFSATFGMTLWLVVISLRRGGLVNRTLALVAGAGLAGMLYLMCIF